MLVTRLFLITVLTFFLANIYSSQIRAVMDIWKWGAFLLLAFVLVTGVVKRTEFPSIIPLHVHLCFAFIFIEGSIVTISAAGIGSGVAKLAGWGFLLYVAYNLYKHFVTDTDRNNYYRIMLLVSKVIIYSTMVFYIFNINLGRFSEGSGRFTGWVDNPNTLAMLCLPLFPFLLLYSIKNKSISIGSPRVLLAMLAFIIMLTGARSVLAASVVATIVIVSYQKGGKDRLVLLAILGALAVTFVGFEIQSFVENFSTFQRSGDLALSGREKVWALAIMLIDQNPYFGYGFDSEGALIKQYHELLLGHQGKVIHNSYLSYVISIGLIGAIPLVWIILYSLYSVFKIRSSSHNESEFNFKLVSGALVMASFIHAIFETWLFSPGNHATLLFWVSFFCLNSRKSGIIENTSKRNKLNTGQ